MRRRNASTEKSSPSSRTSAKTSAASMTGDVDPTFTVHKNAIPTDHSKPAMSLKGEGGQKGVRASVSHHEIGSYDTSAIRVARWETSPPSAPRPKRSLRTDAWFTSSAGGCNGLAIAPSSGGGTPSSLRFCTGWKEVEVCSRRSTGALNASRTGGSDGAQRVATSGVTGRSADHDARRRSATDGSNTRRGAASPTPWKPVPGVHR
jgi:hypothetical protein